jgi:hypothetical protein
MNKPKFVFFDAVDGKVALQINGDLVGSVSNSGELITLLKQSKVSNEDVIYHSSSVDFATEYGFSDDNGAYRIIEPALDCME